MIFIYITCKKRILSHISLYISNNFIEIFRMFAAASCFSLSKSHVENTFIEIIFYSTLQFKFVSSN